MPEVINPVVLRLTIRATMGRKRALIFAITPLVMIIVSAILKVEAKSPVWPPEFLGVFGFTVVVPLTSFFFNDTATTEIYTLSLHDALPISSPTGLIIRQAF